MRPDSKSIPKKEKGAYKQHLILLGYDSFLVRPLGTNWRVGILPSKEGLREGCADGRLL